MPEPLSRREALAAGLAGAAALVLAPTAAAAKPDEGAALTALARAEEDSAFVYLDTGLGLLFAERPEEPEPGGAVDERRILLGARQRRERGALVGLRGGGGGGGRERIEIADAPPPALAATRPVGSAGSRRMSG